MSRWQIFRHNGWQALVSIDQALHNIGGAMWAGLALILVNLPTGQTWADETLSSRCHRWRIAGILWPAKIVNALFWWQDDECYQAVYMNDQGITQMIVNEK